MESKKIFPLLIILVLAASAILTVYPAAAVPNPSIPEFTVQYVDHSYDVPATYGTDPYTGKTIVTNGGYHVDNRTIDVTITNQPFTPYMDPNSNQTVYLYYNLRSKGHFEDWNTNNLHTQNSLKASTSATTVVSFDIQYWNVPDEGQIDFQVQAILSYTASSYSGSCFTGSTTTSVAQSDWSATKTLTMGTPASVQETPQPTWNPNPTSNPTFNPYLPSPTPYQNPTATPNQPNILTGALAGLGWMQTALIVMVVIIAVFVVVVILLLRKVSRK
jgi:hypothetical protein